MPRPDLIFRGDPVELRPNTHPTMGKVVIRDKNAQVIEDAHFDPSAGLVIALDDYPEVSQVAIIPPMGQISLIVPKGATHGG